MDQEQLHLTKACEIQRLDKSWAPGSLFVYTTRAVWRPSAQDAGGAGEQAFPLKDLSERRVLRAPPAVLCPAEAPRWLGQRWVRQPLAFRGRCGPARPRSPAAAAAAAEIGGRRARRAPPSPCPKGQKRSTKNPLLRLELAPPLMLRFPSVDDRDAATNTMKALGERLAAAPAGGGGGAGAAAAAAAAPPPAGAAAAAAAGGGQQAQGRAGTPGSGGGGARAGAGAGGGAPALAMPPEEERRRLLMSNP
jgi:hypothetical protein